MDLFMSGTKQRKVIPCKRKSGINVAKKKKKMNKTRTRRFEFESQFCCVALDKLTSLLEPPYSLSGLPNVALFT